LANIEKNSGRKRAKLLLIGQIVFISIKIVETTEHKKRKYHYNNCKRMKVQWAKIYQCKITIGKHQNEMGNCPFTLLLTTPLSGDQFFEVIQNQ
jgi:hypothetical protein